MKKTISMVMTPHVHSIGSDIRLSIAREQMKKFGIRHLPVLKAGKIIGVLSDRDIKLMGRFPGFEDFSAEDAMTPDPYVVGPDTPFAEVVKEMAESKVGSALVAEKEKILGIFTAVDGMKLLAAIY